MSTETAIPESEQILALNDANVTNEGLPATSNDASTAPAKDNFVICAPEETFTAAPNPSESTANEHGGSLKTAEKENAETPTAPKPRRKRIARVVKRKKVNPHHPQGCLGTVDTFEGFQEARMALNQRVPWFRDHPINGTLPMKHLEVPEGLDWDDSLAVKTAFPRFRLNDGTYLGSRLVPRCLLMDAQSPTEKLIVTNWWRMMSAEQHKEYSSVEHIHRYYRAPTRSNSPYKLLHPEISGAGTIMPNFADHEAVVTTQQRVAAPSATELAQPVDRPQSPTILAPGESRNRPRILSIVKGKRFPGFRCMLTAADVAKYFSLSLDQVFCARIAPDDLKCAVENCQYPALELNRNLCCLHKQLWWPRNDIEHYQKRRGHFLLGVEYALRPGKKDVPAVSKVKVVPIPCGCSNATCEGIGWSADTIRVPKGYQLPECVMPSNRREKDRPVRLAPWHFAPEYRMQLPDGTWKLVIEGRKADNFPMPDYSPDDFLKEPGMIEYVSRKSPYLLPEWVREMQVVEEGPLTLHEFQLDALWKQRNALRQELVSRTVEHQELSEEHHHAETKLEQMKKTHIHKRSIKRTKAEGSNLKRGRKLGSTKRTNGDEDDGALMTAKKKSRRAGDFPTTIDFRPVHDDLSSAGSDGALGAHHEDTLQRRAHGTTGPPAAVAAPTLVHAAPATTRTFDARMVHDYLDETAMHEGAQAMQYLHNPGVTMNLHHHHHPHGLQQHVAHQQQHHQQHHHHNQHQQQQQQQQHHHQMPNHPHPPQNPYVPYATGGQQMTHNSAFYPFGDTTTGATTGSTNNDMGAVKPNVPRAPPPNMTDPTGNNNNPNRARGWGSVFGSGFR